MEAAGHINSDLMPGLAPGPDFSHVWWRWIRRQYVLIQIGSTFRLGHVIVLWKDLWLFQWIFSFPEYFLEMARVNSFPFYPTGAQNQGKHKWEEAEVLAVERHMMHLIEGHVVPQKKDCIKCLEAEPEALKTRSWKGVKDYVRNRITALKRQNKSAKAKSTNSTWSGQAEQRQQIQFHWTSWKWKGRKRTGRETGARHVKQDAGWDWVVVMWHVHLLPW